MYVSLVMVSVDILGVVSLCSGAGSTRDFVPSHSLGLGPQLPLPLLYQDVASRTSEIVEQPTNLIPLVGYISGLECWTLSE